VAVGDWGGRIDLWDARGAAIVRTLQAAGPPVGALAFSAADGSLASLHWDGNVRIWDPAAGRLVRTFRVRPEFTDNPRWFVFAPDGSRLYASTNYIEVQAFDPRTGRPAWPQPLAEVFHFAAAPDGRTVAFTRIRSQEVYFLDPAAPDRVTAASPSGSGGRNVECHGLAFVPDGRLASAHADGSVRVWDVGKRTELAVLRGNTGPVYRVYAAREGHWLVTRGAGGWAVWDLAAGVPVDTFPDLAPRLKQNGADPGDWPDPSGLLPADWLSRIRPPSGPDWPTGEAAWEALAGADGAAAYRALCGLMADPKAAARLFRAHLSPAVGPPTDRVAKLIAQLDAPKFADREAAMRGLADLGPLARPAVRDALARGPSAEAADRLRKLLDVPVGKPSPAEVRVARAVQVLEAAGTPEARALLAEWAGGARGPALTEAARRAVERLDRCGSGKQ
jgi:outer membrane protein assembly factor BamB